MKETKNTTTSPLAEQARAARNAYHREWQKNNRDKVNAIQRRYWEKKAREMMNASGEQEEEK